MKMQSPVAGYQHQYCYWWQYWWVGVGWGLLYPNWYAKGCAQDWGEGSE